VARPISAAVGGGDGRSVSEDAADDEPDELEPDPEPDEL
jgi:hypothetical protein